MGLERDFSLTEEHLALACASHSGGEIHLNVAKDWLQKTKLDEKDLLCGPHLPYDKIELKKLKIEIVKPSINKCFSDFRAIKGKLVYGLGAIKNVGYEAISNIINERIKNGKFVSIDDFLKRVNPKDINKLQLEDFELSYTSEGEGRDVLFLHGFPSNMFFWDDIKNDLKDKLRVTVVEQRGYPLSSIQNSIESDFNIKNLSLDIENLINELNLSNNLTIVGHDWGSIVAWAIVSRGNVDIEKMISISGGTEFPPSEIYKKLIYKKKP